MPQVLEIDEPLTTDEVEQVRTFAAFLVTRRSKPQQAGSTAANPISFEGWAGCLAHVRPELSNEEFMRSIEDERIAEAMK